MIEKTATQLINEELKKYQIQNSINKIISNKEGIIVARIISSTERYIIKLINNDIYLREIENYTLLNKLGIQTATVIYSSNRSILLEDIESSFHFRLAKKNDMDKPNVIRAIASWYRELHSKGEEYFTNNNDKCLYSETNQINEDAVKLIKKKSGYNNSKFWEKLLYILPVIKEQCQKYKTITYNDFHYTNLAVSKNEKRAFMFDYNLLGEGLAYSDVRNVTYDLSDNMKKVFLDTYGETDIRQELIDNVISPVFTLSVAYKRTIFPMWGQNELDALLTGKVENALGILFKYFQL